MGDDMRFTPSHIEVKLGETVRLVVHNDGKVLHELVLGTRAELDKHAALMLKHPNMAHDDPWMAHVDPGKSGDIYWTFNRAGSFEFACLIPGHFQAGMRGTLRVSTSGVDSGAAPAANTAEEWVEAVIRRVDPDQSRLTLRHGEIKSLDMPPMTMVFHVRDARLLNGLAAGDSVRFRTVQDDGRYIVTAIEKR
jgi:Cu/Ag efflux protein CusF